jgi:SAM-dependent methyltransferase
MDSFADLSSFYDLDYPDTADHAFLRRLVSAADPGRLLEIPCGSGRNVVPLLESSSRRVTFMDIAGEMAAEAGRRIPAAQRARARAIPGDITSLPPSREFDLVICPREAFQLLSRAEAARALRSLAAASTGDGLIVLDLFTFTREQARPADTPPDYFSPEEHDWVQDWTRTAPDHSLTVTRHRRQRFTAGGVHFEMRYALRVPGEPEPRRLSLEFDMANHAPQRMRELAAGAGLDVLAAWAGYGAAPGRSLRTVYVLGRGQQARERLERVRGQVTADRPAAEPH